MEKRQFPLFIVSVCLACTLLLPACDSRPAASTRQSRSESAASSQPADTPSTLPAQSGRDDRPVLVTFGDSLTAGVAGRSYPDDLQDLLDANGIKVRVDNQGVSGDTTTDGLARIDNVVAVKPILVVLEFGGNDGLRGTPVEATRANLQAMIGRLKQADIPIVLLGITLPPNYGPDYVKPFTAMFPELAKQYNLPIMPFLLLHVYQNRALMQPDGIHPNGEGNKILAHDVFELIRPLVQKASKEHASR